MADDDQQENQQDNQDEYQFADLDVLGTEQDAVSSSESEDESVGNNTGNSGDGVSSPPGRGRFDHLDPKVVNTLRKGVIAVAALILVLVVYKGLTGFFSSKSASSKKASTASAPAIAQVTKPVSQQASIPISAPTTQSNAPVVRADSNALSSIKTEQKQIEEELVDIRTQINAVTQSMSDVSTKMTDVQQTMLVLSERLEQQSQQMGRLQTISRSKRVTSSRSSARTRPAAVRTVYSIQAIIPGRAWLMSDQGKSLTVSRGSPVPGYGAVRIVNAKLGRVFTSSGRVIRFSQADS
jgi:intracellular multiplication protein IcmG